MKAGAILRGGTSALFGKMTTLQLLPGPDCNSSPFMTADMPGRQRSRLDWSAALILRNGSCSDRLAKRFESYDDMTYPDDSTLRALAAKLMRRTR